MNETVKGLMTESGKGQPPSIAGVARWERGGITDNDSQIESQGWFGFDKNGKRLAFVADGLDIPNASENGATFPVVRIYINPDGAIQVNGYLAESGVTAPVSTAMTKATELLTDAIEKRKQELQAPAKIGE